MEGEHIIEPLLYIDQPELTHKPKAYMQADYNGKKSTTMEQKDEEENNFEGAFKDLSIDDKINYLVDLPQEVPRIRCEIITEEQEYKGIITEKNEEEIIFRVFGRGNRVIQKNKIKNIHLIGF